MGADQATIFLKWGYDFSSDYTTVEYTTSSPEVSFYGVSEFGIGKFTAGVAANQKVVNATGNGTTVVVGLKQTSNGSALSLQEINVLALIGKLL